MATEPVDLDIAVVGGGISGVYTAWRLSSCPNPPTVALFESSQRLGGRIDTVPLPVSEPGSHAEFGAMRFMPFMAVVKSLLSYLGIQTEVFPCNDLRQMFIRGVQIALDSKGFATNSHYRLAPGEPQNVFSLAMNVLDGAVPNAQSLTPQQWRDVTKNGAFKGRELWRWGMRNVAEELISNEAFDFVYDGLGLDSVLLGTNAAMGTRALAAPLPDYLAGRVYRPVNGFSSLVAELENRLQSFPSCNVWKQHRLISAVRAGNGIKLTFDAPAGPIEVTARKVALAMPRRAIELIDLDGLFPADQRDAERRKLRTKLRAVRGVPGFKLCLVYDKPWWQNFTNVSGATQGWKNGYLVTDLPLRQIFFGIGNGPDSAGNERVLMASYSDGAAARYWEGLTQVSDKRLHMGAASQFVQAESGNLLTAIERQLCSVMQIKGPVPPPLCAGYVDWEVDPFGGAWHEWKVGIDVSAAIPDMRRPAPELPLYVCGEAYSWFQAWIEGALMSAERMLQDHFQLPWPSDWLQEGYDLGP
ncbi:MAG: FAD-dependent oxidoreductase [Bryobacteraceae bacterium]